MGSPVIEIEMVRVGNEWFRVLRPQRWMDLMAVQERVLQIQWERAKNPLVWKQIEQGLHPHPVVWVRKFVNAITRAWERGIIPLVNRNGGWRPLDRNGKIEEEKFVDVWPLPYEDEVFIIEKWQEGNHYYVRSQHRSSNPLRFDTEGEAVGWCKSQNPIAKINATKII